MLGEEQPTNGEAYRNRLRRAVEDDFDTLVEDLFSRLAKELPDYDAGANHADDLRAAVRHSARLVVTATFGGNVGAAERAVWRVIGAQRARAGFRRESVAAAPGVAMRRGFDFVLEKSTAIPAPGPLAAGVLRELWTRLDAETAAVTEALLAGYDEQRRLDLSESTRPQLALVDRLLSHVWEDREEMVERGRRLGVDLTAPHGALVLVSLRDSTAELGLAIKECSRLAPDAIEGPCRTWPRPHLLLLVPARPAEPWRTLLARLGTVAQEHRLAIVVVEPLSPLDSLEAQYHAVVRSLVALPAAASTPGIVTTFDLQYHWWLSQVPLEGRVDVVRAVLGPVLDTAKAGELLDLLDAFYETRAGPSGAAQVLAVHPNTVNNRKRRFHELTGLSLDVPGDAHRLFTARLFQKMLAASGSALVADQDLL